MANSNFIVKNGLTVGNVTIDASTSNVSGINSLSFASGTNGTLAAGNSNVLVVANGNVAVSSTGNANVLIVTGTGANISGTANVTGNANVGNLGTGGLIVATGNVTGGNLVTGGALSVTGNANTGNLGTGTIIATTANLTTINSGLVQNGNSNVTVTTNGNVTINVTTANNYQFSTGSILPNANGTQNLGGATNYFATVYGKATTAQYADVAELYDSDAPYEPGTVLEFGGDNEVTICNSVMSTRVAGVVSTNPALRMNSSIVANNTIELALLGRVPTKVIGLVSKGDMMVSAGNGYATACTEPVIGSVIGKALEDFSGPVGVIEVVVGRV